MLPNTLHALLSRGSIAIPAPAWTPASLATAAVVWIEPQDLVASIADGGNISSLTDRRSITWNAEAVGNPLLRYSTLNGLATIETNVAQPAAGIRTTTSVNLGYSTYYAVWKSTSNVNTSPFPQLYVAHSIGSVYSQNSSYLYGNDATFVQVRDTSTARAYLDPTTKPAGGLNVYQSYAAGYKAGIGPWAEIGGVAVAGSIVGNAPNATFGNTHSAPIHCGGGRYNNGLTDNDQRSKGNLAFLMILAYEASPSDHTLIMNYINTRFAL